MLRLNKFDILWLEKEFLPWLPSWIELGLLPNKVLLVVDYDDAVFHRYDQHRFLLVRRLLGKKISAVMRRADLVIVGNDYLADHARKAGAKRIAYLPTVVDTTKYSASSTGSVGQVTIGWIGSPSTAHYLNLIAPVLREIVTRCNARFLAVGANAAQLKDLPIDVKEWTEVSEINNIQQFDIGIMPLPNELFEQGKCGYKLIQYMACGKPVVASPIGVNSVIVHHGENGFLAANNDEWIVYLSKLCESPLLRKTMGEAGRSRVETEYSLEVAAPRLEQLLYSMEEHSCVD